MAYLIKNGYVLATGISDCEVHGLASLAWEPGAIQSALAAITLEILLNGQSCFENW